MGASGGGRPGRAMAIGALGLAIAFGAVAGGASAPRTGFGGRGASHQGPVVERPDGGADPRPGRAALPPVGPDDVAVVQALLRQRQQSVDLVELAAGRSDDDRVLTLAASVAARAEPELDRLQDLLWRWRADATGGAHDHDATRAGTAAVAADDLVAGAVDVAAPAAWSAPAGLDRFPPAAVASFGAGPVACTIPTRRLEDLAGLEGRDFDAVLGRLLRRHETSAARVARARAGARLGPEGAAAVRRAIVDQQAVLTELLSWPAPGNATSG